MDLAQIAVIVPSYNPDEKLISVVTGLRDIGFSHIIVVDDGSEKNKKKFFPDADISSGLIILKHDVNRGKGAAMKTAFSYFLKNMGELDGVITVDGDNQHKPQDVMACAEKMQQSGKVVLGVRDFSLPYVPRRSRFGNKLTSLIFRFAIGLKISDTQTGLRAIPTKYLEKMLSVAGDRYEYETNMLLKFKDDSIPFEEVKITTVYINENETSHFNPVKDSIRIYGQLLKYIASSAVSWAVDVILFFLFSLFFGDLLGDYAIAVCTVGARVFSALINFLINSKLVFSSKCGMKKSFRRYLVLASCQVCASMGLVYLFTHLVGNDGAGISTVFKVIADTILFLCCYKFQQNWVFSDKK